MKVLIVIPTLGLGGAERVALYQAEAFKKAGYDTSLLTTYAAEDFYTLPSDIPRIRLDLPQTPFYKNPVKLWQRFSMLNKTFKQESPDIIIIHMDVFAALTAWISGIKYIFAEHTDMFSMPAGIKKKFTIKKAAAAVVLTDADAGLVKKWGGKPEIIYNPAVPPPLDNDKRPPFLKEKNNVTAVARLTKQKGFDMLIEAWARIDESIRQDWQLTIVGSGEEHDSLEKAVAESKIKNIVLPGFYKNVGAVYKYSDILVVSSRWEAFPMSLCEGMSWGAPVVSFKVRGTDVIVRDEEDGFLVPKGDVGSLSKRLAELMSDEQKRKSFSEKAKEVCDRFSPEKFFRSYETLVKKIIAS
ncbi:Glycosyltransferase involved in cell wall bisynthesis [Parelusimicrobium proximum]|uniref:glycosyltransferase n=1 Tax=Parelusimicrobium proximum TaxID=3228953 RepID=UPI003D175EAD